MTLDAASRVATTIDSEPAAQILEDMDIIAERTLTFEVPGEPPGALRVIVGKPEQSAEGEWIAPYEIHGPGASEVRQFGARGVDAWQALRLSLWILPQELTLYAKRGRLTWEGDPDWLGDPPSTSLP
jgi:hypothetical protein